MIVTKLMLIINIVILLIAIMTISATSYGLGINKDDKAGPAYQSASTFLTISIFFVIISIISLGIMLVSFSSGSYENVVKMLQTPGSV